MYFAIKSYKMSYLQINALDSRLNCNILNKHCKHSYCK